MSDHTPHIFLSAGEASGDIHGAPLIREILRRTPARVTFLGGDEMAVAAGVQPLIHYREMAYMGFAQVIRHAPQLLSNLRRAKESITGQRPDAVVLIDYPSFNLRLAEHAHRLGIPVFYYIAPKVWAWKEWRIKQLRKFCTRVLSILPFEEEYFRSRGLDVKYVGNPTFDELRSRPASERLSRSEVCRRAGFDGDRPYVALVPGSRRSEIRLNLPIMEEAARIGAPGHAAIVTGAPGIEPEFYKGLTSLPVVFGITHSIVEQASAALVTSGTATLETAILGTPQVACYRGSGSKLQYSIMSRVLKCPYVTLPNLIASAPIIPELLLHHCTPAAAAAALAPLLPASPKKTAAEIPPQKLEIPPQELEIPPQELEISPQRAAMLDAYRNLRSQLTPSDPSASAPALAAAEILSALKL